MGGLSSRETRKSNRAELLVPSRLWSHTRWYGEKCNDKNRCQQYLHDIGYSGQGAYDNEKSVVGCGLCQTRVPCEFRNPVSKLNPGKR